MHDIFEIALIFDQICYYLDYNKIHLLNIRQVCSNFYSFIGTYYSYVTLGEWERSDQIIQRHGINDSIDRKNLYTFCADKGICIYLFIINEKSVRFKFVSPFHSNSKILSHYAEIPLDTPVQYHRFFKFNKHFTVDGTDHYLICLYSVAKCSIIDYTNIHYPITFNDINMKVCSTIEPDTFDDLLFQFRLCEKIPDFTSLPFVNKTKLTTKHRINSSNLQGKDLSLNGDICLNNNNHTVIIYRGTEKMCEKNVPPLSKINFISDSYIMLTLDGFFNIYDMISDTPFIQVPLNGSIFHRCFKLTRHHFLFKICGNSNVYNFVDVKKRKMIPQSFNYFDFFDYHSKLNRLNEDQIEILRYDNSNSKIYSCVADLFNLIVGPISIKKL